MEKNKGGRPRKPNAAKYSRFFHVRLTEDQYKTLQKMAEYQGGTAGQFLRNMLNEAIERGHNAAGAADIYEGAHERGA